MHGEEEIKTFITIGEASKLSGLDIQTIRKLMDTEKISGFKTPSGHRRIDKNSIQKMLKIVHGSEDKQTEKRQSFIYTRVSTKKQMDDLSRQIEYIQRIPEYSGFTLISDIGSGINFKRKGLQTLLDCCLQHRIGEVVIAHRDRLCRFGFELIESFITKAGGTVTVLANEGKKTDDTKELADDILAIITIFSCRQMGKRSYKNRPKQIQDDKNKNIPNDEAKRDLK
jgi:putative resolvase